MSNTMPPPGYGIPAAAPAGQPRPGTVTAASGLLYLLAVISLITAGLSAYAASLLDADVYKQLYQDAGMSESQAEQAAPIAASLGLVGAVPWVVFAILYLIVAISVGRGKQWARIMSWILAGISALCCFGLGLLGNAAGGMMSGMSGTSGVNQGELTRRIQDLQPDWLPPVNIALDVVGLICAILVIVLLMLPPSHPYFRKAEPQWTPPAYPAP